MTVTLVSSGNNSLVTDGTGPSLQIRGLSGGIGINVDSSSITLIPTAAPLRNVQRFYDDFNYYAGTGIYLNDGDNPLWKNHLWNAEGVTGAGVTMCYVISQNTYGSVLKFDNNYNPSWIFIYPWASGWEMKANNAAISIGTNQVIYETRFNVTQSSPYFTAWNFKLGLKSNNNAFIGVEFNRQYDTNVRYVLNGSQAAGPTFYDTNGVWLKLKIIFNSTAGTVEYYLNDNLVTTFSGQSLSGYYCPYMYSYIYVDDDQDSPGFEFYLDYIDFIGNGQRQ